VKIFGKAGKTIVMQTTEHQCLKRYCTGLQKSFSGNAKSKTLHSLQTYLREQQW